MHPLLVLVASAPAGITAPAYLAPDETRSLAIHYDCELEAWYALEPTGRRVRSKREVEGGWIVVVDVPDAGECDELRHAVVRVDTAGWVRVLRGGRRAWRMGYAGTALASRRVYAVERGAPAGTEAAPALFTGTVGIGGVYVGHFDKEHRGLLEAYAVVRGPLACLDDLDVADGSAVAFVVTGFRTGGIIAGGAIVRELVAECAVLAPPSPRPHSDKFE